MGSAIVNSACSVFSRCWAIRHLKNFPEFSPSGLQFHDQRTKWVHYFYTFCGHQFLVGTLSDISAAKEVVKARTPWGLIRTVLFGNRRPLINGAGTYQSRAEICAR
jgi:hypothetical protein